MSASTIEAYILSRRAGDSPRGDFLRDCQEDIRTGRFPDGMTEEHQLQSYLARCGACDEARRQAHRVWVEYRRAKQWSAWSMHAD